MQAMQRVIVEPIDGWGFFERDGLLRSSFAAEVEEVGPGSMVYDRGWAGRITSPEHPYVGKHVIMTPRHVEWDGVVVLHVHDDKGLTDEGLVFSGMAEAKRLECSWK